MLEKGAIWGLIALFLTNQIAGNTIDFKMNVIRNKITPQCTDRTNYWHILPIKQRFTQPPTALTN